MELVLPDLCALKRCNAAEAVVEKLEQKMCLSETLHAVVGMPDALVSKAVVIKLEPVQDVSHLVGEKEDISVLEEPEV